MGKLYEMYAIYDAASIKKKVIRLNGRWYKFKDELTPIVRMLYKNKMVRAILNDKAEVVELTLI